MIDELDQPPGHPPLAVLPDRFGDRVTSLRHERRLSQTALARACGISPSYLSRIEAGQREPSTDILAALAHRLGANPHSLRTGVGATLEGALETVLTRARADLDAGRPAAAVAGFCEVLARPEVAHLPHVFEAAILGQALAAEAAGGGEAAATIERRMRSVPAGSEPWVRLATALCRCLVGSGAVLEAIRLGELVFERLGRPRCWTVSQARFAIAVLGAHVQAGDHHYARTLADTVLRRTRGLGAASRLAARAAALAAAEAGGRCAQAVELAGETIELAARRGGASADVVAARMAAARVLLGAGLRTADAARRQFMAIEALLPGGAAHRADRVACAAGRARAELLLGRPVAATRITCRLISGPLPVPPLLAAQVHRTHAAACLQLGRRAAAAVTLQRAETLLTNVRSSLQAAQVWADLAGLYALAGDAQRREGALRRALSCAAL